MQRQPYSAEGILLDKPVKVISSGERPENSYIESRIYLLESGEMESGGSGVDFT